MIYAVINQKGGVGKSSIFDYAAKANVTEDFQNFINELLEVSE